MKWVIIYSYRNPLTSSAGILCLLKTEYKCMLSVNTLSCTLQAVVYICLKRADFEFSCIICSYYNVVILHLMSIPGHN